MLETDYLIVGSGAVGMAFADVLLTETKARIIIVDKYAKPGGHWNVAYPFVTLHQPSSFYGVSSRVLGKNMKYEIGLNKGLYDLASGAEVSAYFDDVMQHQFLPTGRVQYFPLCDYQGNNKFVSMITGEEFEVKVNNKIVDATFLKTSVPSTHTPNFTIASEIPFLPLNDLPKMTTAPAGFVVIGGGKTGIDACLWLLENRVHPDEITWIVSRDAWLLDRRNVQPGEEFFEYSMGTQTAQLEAIVGAKSITDMFDKLETAGVFLRLDKNVRPRMFHGATISQLELEQLQRIKNIVRKGRVQRIEKDKIILDRGTIPTSTTHLHVDCSATPFTNIGTKEIFKGNIITPQTVRPYQPIFSAAFIAYIEANFEKEEQKNEICGIVALPNHDTDWLRMMEGMIENQFNWSKYKEIRNWLYHNRLDGFSKMVKDTPKEDVKKQSILKRMKRTTLPAFIKMQELLKDIRPIDSTLKNAQLQMRKNLFLKNRLVEIPEEDLQIGTAEILLKIDKFAFSSNNITYAVAGDRLGYWKFFPPTGEQTAGWGVLPVWGFADVVESNVSEIPVGDRLFGYFPPATYLKMKPTKISDQQLIDGSAHRQKLPIGYNIYRRVKAERTYSRAMDEGRALLFPLYLTAYCLWDVMQEKNWYGAEQILILSASSKTSIGLAYALQADETAPKVIAMTSKRNLKMVNSLNLYDESISYDNIQSIDATVPTLIVDMSGNGNLMLNLHQYLGDQMKYTINVGLTHWANAQPKKGIITQRSEFFFAPSQAQKRIKEWGMATFNQKTTTFIMTAAIKTSQWLNFKTIDGLAGMADIHLAVCNGQIPPNEGLIIKL